MTNTQSEFNAIKMLVDGASPELLIKFDRSHFGNPELGNIFLLIRHHYLEHGEFPGWQVLSASVASRCKSTDKARQLMGLLEQIRERDIRGLSGESLVAELQATAKVRTILDGVEEMVSAASNKDAERTLSLLKQLHDKAFLQGASTSIDAGSLLARADQDLVFNWCSSGINAIDRRNGFADGWLILLGGDSGTGKSTLAHMLGLHMFKKNAESVYYRTWEQGTGELMARIFSCHSGVDLGNIISDDLDAEERLRLRKAKIELLFQINSDVDINSWLEEMKEVLEKDFLKEARKSYTPKTNNFFLYDDGCDFDQLLIEMELMFATRGVRLFILDYLTIIPKGVEHRGMQSWEAYIKMTDRLKNFCNRTRSKVILPLQFDAKEGTIRFSKNIINAADLAIWMSQDAEDKEMDTVTFEFGKYRNYKTIKGEPLQSFKLMKAFATARFQEVSF